MPEKADDLERPIEEMELPRRAMTALKALGAKCLRDVAAIEPADLLQLRNFGATTLAKLTERLSEYGLRVGMQAKEGRAIVSQEPGHEAPCGADTPIVRLPMSRRLYNTLRRMGISTLRQATAFSAEMILTQRNAGRRTLMELEHHLAEHGLRLDRDSPKPAPWRMPKSQMPQARGRAKPNRGRSLSVHALETRAARTTDETRAAALTRVMAREEASFPAAASPDLEARTQPGRHGHRRSASAVQSAGGAMEDVLGSVRALAADRRRLREAAERIAEIIRETLGT